FSLSGRSVRQSRENGKMITIADLFLLGSFLYSISGIMVHQWQPAVASKRGSSVILPCSSSEDAVEIWVWVKHVPGRAFIPVVSSYYQSYTFEKGAEESNLEIKMNQNSFNLTFKSVEASDEGTYYCGVYWYNHFYLGDGVFLFVSDSPTVQVQQHYLLDPASEGDDVTLNCTVVSGGCAGEHSVYWFRHGTPGSQPGIIYTHGDRSAGCEKNPEAGSSTQSCVYHLPKRNLSTTDAGTYYCAVAACGRIVTGKGARLEVTGESQSSNILLVLLWRRAGTFIYYDAVIFTEMSWLQFFRHKKRSLQARKGRLLLELYAVPTLINQRRMTRRS
uniref:Ig-like domain-containing protein n=1 Tax=Denticeps clupeoides TaxID=299321 RepID=A0AAY4DEQ7_9TELE